MQGAKAHCGPVARVSSAAMCSTSRTSAGSRVAPRPMLCGKTVAPYMLPSPCTESIAVDERDVQPGRQRGLLVAVDHVGPGLRRVRASAPSRRRRARCRGRQVRDLAVSVSIAARSACVIWPIFSSSVMRESRSATRCAHGQLRVLVGQRRGLGGVRRGWGRRLAPERGRATASAAAAASGAMSGLARDMARGARGWVEDIGAPFQRYTPGRRSTTFGRGLRLHDPQVARRVGRTSMAVSWPGPVARRDGVRQRGAVRGWRTSR